MKKRLRSDVHAALRVNVAELDSPLGVLEA
jgi:hypothetical protein